MGTGVCGQHLQTYEDFNRAKAEMAAVVETFQTMSTEIELSEQFENRLRRLHHLVRNEKFRVIVIGGFSRGKSTLINALFGEKVLPAKMTPTTAVITVIKYGDEPKAILHYKDSNLEPSPIPMEQLREHLVIPTTAAVGESGGSQINSPIELVEIYYPLELCKNGVEIIDSPGLEENEIRQRITMRFLNGCDAAVVVLSCAQLISAREESFIKEELQKRGFDHVFYVLNYADLIIDGEEEELQQRFISKLGDKERSFPLSARDALAAKTTDNRNKLKRSGFCEFEAALEAFLVQQPGLLKLQSARKLLFVYLDELRDLVRVRLNLLENSQVEDFERIERELEKKKDAIAEREEYVLRRVGEKGSHIAELLFNSFSRKCSAIARELPSIAQDMETEASILSRTEYQHAVAEALSRWVEMELRGWMEKDAKRILEQEGKRLEEIIEQNIDDIVYELDQLKTYLDPSFVPQVATKEGGFQRLMAAGGSLLFGDVAGPITGGVFGIEGSVLQIGGVVMVNWLLYLVGFLNPLTAIISSVAIAAGIFKMLGPKLRTEMRMDIATQLGDAIRDLPEEQEKVLKKRIFSELNKIGNSVKDGVAAILADLENQVASAKKDLLENKYAAIDKYENMLIQLDAISSEVDERNFA